MSSTSTSSLLLSKNNRTTTVRPMVYRLLMLSDENDFFKREIQIDSEATFLELNDFILDSLGYAHDELTTFHLCDEDWQKEQEVTMMDMGMSSDEDSYLMSETALEDLLDQKGQHLFFVFDMLSERGFFIELAELIPGKSLDKPVVTKAEGKAPKQLESIEVAASRLATPATGEPWDDELFSDESVDEGDIDLEGFDIADAESLY